MSQGNGDLIREVCNGQLRARRSALNSSPIHQLRSPSHSSLQLSSTPRNKLRSTMSSVLYRRKARVPHLANDKETVFSASYSVDESRLESVYTEEPTVVSGTDNGVWAKLERFADEYLLLEESTSSVYESDSSSDEYYSTMSESAMSSLDADEMHPRRHRSLDSRSKKKRTKSKKQIGKRGTQGMVYHPPIKTTNGDPRPPLQVPYERSRTIQSGITCDIRSTDEDGESTVLDETTRPLSPPRLVKRWKAARQVRDPSPERPPRAHDTPVSHHSEKVTSSTTQNKPMTAKVGSRTEELVLRSRTQSESRSDNNSTGRVAHSEARVKEEEEEIDFRQQAPLSPLWNSKSLWAGENDVSPRVEATHQTPLHSARVLQEKSKSKLPWSERKKHFKNLDLFLDERRRKGNGDTPTSATSSKRSRRTMFRSPISRKYGVRELDAKLEKIAENIVTEREESDPKQNLATFLEHQEPRSEPIATDDDQSIEVDLMNSFVQDTNTSKSEQQDNAHQGTESDDEQSIEVDLSNVVDAIATPATRALNTKNLHRKRPKQTISVQKAKKIAEKLLQLKEKRGILSGRKEEPMTTASTEQSIEVDVEGVGVPAATVSQPLEGHTPLPSNEPTTATDSKEATTCHTDHAADENASRARDAKVRESMNATNATRSETPEGDPVGAESVLRSYNQESGATLGPDFMILDPFISMFQNPAEQASLTEPIAPKDEKLLALPNNRTVSTLSRQTFDYIAEENNVEVEALSPRSQSSHRRGIEPEGVLSPNTASDSVRQRTQNDVPLVKIDRSKSPPRKAPQGDPSGMRLRSRVPRKNQSRCSVGDSRCAPLVSPHNNEGFEIERISPKKHEDPSTTLVSTDLERRPGRIESVRSDPERELAEKLKPRRKRIRPRGHTPRQQVVDGRTETIDFPLAEQPATLERAPGSVPLPANSPCHEAVSNEDQGESHLFGQLGCPVESPGAANTHTDRGIEIDPFPSTTKVPAPIKTDLLSPIEEEDSVPEAADDLPTKSKSMGEILKSPFQYGFMSPRKRGLKLGRKGQGVRRGLFRRALSPKRLTSPRKVDSKERPLLNNSSSDRDLMVPKMESPQKRERRRPSLISPPRVSAPFAILDSENDMSYENAEALTTISKAMAGDFSYGGVDMVYVSPAMCAVGPQTEPSVEEKDELLILKDSSDESDDTESRVTDMLERRRRGGRWSKIASKIGGIWNTSRGGTQSLHSGNRRRSKDTIKDMPLNIAAPHQDDGETAAETESTNGATATKQPSPYNRIPSLLPTNKGAQKPSPYNRIPSHLPISKVEKHPCSAISKMDVPPEKKERKDSTSIKAAASTGNSLLETVVTMSSSTENMSEEHLDVVERKLKRRLQADLKILAAIDRRRRKKKHQDQPSQFAQTVSTLMSGLRSPREQHPDSPAGNWLSGWFSCGPETQCS